MYPLPDKPKIVIHVRNGVAVAAQTNIDSNTEVVICTNSVEFEREKRGVTFKVNPEKLVTPATPGPWDEASRYKFNT